jgi:hypothetical protein
MKAFRQPLPARAAQCPGLFERFDLHYRDNYLIEVMAAVTDQWETLSYAASRARNY